jgi:outer membrane lipoprotein LolB
MIRAVLTGPGRAGAALLWLSLALAQGGCAMLGTSGTGSSGPSAQAWSARHAELSRLDHWLMQARIASGRMGWSGNLHWRQDADHFDIRVSGPLGSGSFQARGHLGEVEIRTAQESLITQNPEALLREKMGWSLPLAQLRYWSIGLPYPTTPAAVRYDALGRLQSLEQDGWRLEYTEYGFYQHYELPRRFTLEDADNYFRVFIDAWSEIG